MPNQTGSLEMTDLAASSQKGDGFPGVTEQEEHDPAGKDKPSLLEFFDQEGGYRRFLQSIKATKHPVLPLPNEEQARAIIGHKGEEGLVELFQKREQAICREKSDPLDFGWEPPQWKDADRLLDDPESKDVLVLGGNRAGKSEWAAKRICQKFRDIPGANIWCLSTSHETSVRDQQKLVWKYFPSQWKNLGKTTNARILYSQAKGFSDRVVVAPNGSEIRFMNYQQDKDVIEGGQIDMFWADELIPLDWLETIRGRTIDRRGKGIVSFTPITGYTPTVAYYMNGAKPTRWVKCDLFPTQKHWPGVPVGHVPYTMECMDSSHSVIFFQPKQNPYIPYEGLIKVWRNKPMSEALCRIHGLTRKTSGNVFPRFGKHNIVKEGDIPDRGTNYFIVDFAWRKNWSMIWLRVADDDRVYVYREWPDFETYGEWVMPSSKPDGAAGPAQESLGYGIGDYKSVIRHLEAHQEKIFARYGDPRSGASTAITEDGQTTIIELLSDDATGEPVIIEPISNREGAGHILHGVGLINQWLEYDPDNEITETNRPRFYVSERCRNVIDCMKMWTGQDGTSGASKDFVDLVRYAAMMDIAYFNPNIPRSRGGGSY